MFGEVIVIMDFDAKCVSVIESSLFWGFLLNYLNDLLMQMTLAWF